MNDRIGNRTARNPDMTGDRGEHSISFILSLTFFLSTSRKNRINKRNRRYVEVGLRAIPRVNSTRFSTFAIKGRIYPSAASPIRAPSFIYHARFHVVFGRWIDAPNGFY